MKTLLAVAALAICTTGCVMTKHSNAVSGLTLNVISPDTAFIDNSVKPVKCGTATASGIICFTEGDCSIAAAMKNGGITKIHHVDYKVKNILGIVGETTTLVYGE
ncbi:MAG: TRL domain-containing protein [Kiritimatiellia bacterium]